MVKSTLLKNNHLLWQVAEEGDTYYLERLPNRSIRISNGFMDTIRNSYEAAQKVKGTVLTKDEQYYYIKLEDNFFGVISIAFLKFKKIYLRNGDEHEFVVHYFDNKQRLLILSI